jgi:very-short-patch-repair endonuclease
MRASLAAVPNSDLPKVAINLLEFYPPEPSERNEIQDLIWADLPAPAIPKRYRRELARAIAIEDLYLDAQRFHNLLERLWVLGPTDVLTTIFGDDSLRAEIQQHVYRNPGDWSVDFLFDRLGALDASDRRFALFLEGLASADVRPEVEAQRYFIDLVNQKLNKCGVEMRETNMEGGYPVFSLVSAHSAPSARPKNLIFASSVKPDLRFRDALNNDIEIVTNKDKVLVYDRPIGVEGLRWSDLQSWWAETNHISNDEQAKGGLYRRLRSILPANSPPQATLFESFYRSFGRAVPDLPALLPEVWLHWDPKTVRERGAQALTRFRMDFLLLVPQGVRIVIEVDGKAHYANEEGRADAVRYAAMARADRELKLAGYHVFRFGAEELQHSDSAETVRAFFELLFKEYRVTVRS